jgi:hypothetical protein
MPKFRVLSDPSEQIAAYRADRRQKRAPVLPAVPEAYTRSVDAHGQFSEKRRSYIPEALAGLRERWDERGAAGRKWIVQKQWLLRAKVCALLDDEARCHLRRHLIMRWSLGLVFAWFAAQQLYDPDAWVDFVPSFMQGVVTLSAPMLIRLHGTLLLVASVGLLAGAGVRLAAGLGAFILLQIIAALAINGEANLVARDIGLLGLALGLVFDLMPASAHEHPSVSINLPRPRRHPLSFHPMVEPPMASVGNSRAGGDAQVGGVLSETGLIGNGNSNPHTEELRAVADFHPFSPRDEQVANSVRASHLIEEMARQDRDDDQHMRRLTETMARLAWLIAGLAVVNTITAIVIAVVAIVVIGRAG